MRVQVGSSLPSPSSPLSMCDVCGGVMFVVLWCVSLKKNVSSIFWALRAGVFSQKSTIAFKTRKITMGEHASAFFVVVVEFAVVRRPSSPPERDRSAQLLINIKKKK